MVLRIFFYLIAFILGLVIGSFLNAVIYRLWQKKSFLKGRSFCPHCKHTLGWKDLIPLVSFLVLKGKCRYCGKKISLQYPLVEISTGILFALVFWVWGLGFDWSLGCSPPGSPLRVQGTWDFFILSYLLIIASFLIIIFIYDLKHFIIPDKVVYPAIFIVLGFRTWNLIGHWSLGFRDFKGLVNPFLAAFGASLFFLAIVLISRGRGMGLGDVKLAFFMGLFLGFPKIIVALFFAFLIGAIIGVGLILAKRKTLKSEVPFGPFLVTGTFIALFAGEKIVQWYLNLLII